KLGPDYNNGNSGVLHSEASRAAGRCTKILTPSTWACPCSQAEHPPTLTASPINCVGHTNTTTFYMCYVVDKDGKHCFGEAEALSCSFQNKAKGNGHCPFCISQRNVRGQQEAIKMGKSGGQLGHLFAS
ncbi:hypothetical protein H1C71_036648, partial [Ictidomys tridecemlineatus]